MKKQDILILAMLLPVVLQAILIVAFGVGGFLYSLIVTFLL
jgi:hypothetical protein